MEQTERRDESHSAPHQVTEDGGVATSLDLENQQVVLILCGLIASGKSTFAESLQSHFPHIVRCNQDDLGDRRSVENLARQTLRQGLSVCVDRTNFDASQRYHWIKIAREFPRCAIWVIVFDTPYATCAARLQERTGHPTITSPQQGLSVLARFAKDFQRPAPGEGYDRILYLKPEDHPSPEYTHADIATILKRVRDSEPVVQPPLNSRNGGFRSNSSRGGGYGGYGGSGWNRDHQDRGQGRGNGSWRGPPPPHAQNQRQVFGGYGIIPGMSTDFRGWGAAGYRGHDGGSGGRGWNMTGTGQGRGAAVPQGNGANDAPSEGKVEG